jgi:hypothetical protein
MALAGTGVEQVTVTGFAAINRYLADIGGKPMQMRVKQANKEAGEVVAVDARAEAPSRSGRLRSSIRVVALMRRVEIRAGSKRIPYANPIHWGWFYDKNNFIYRNIKPNPFMARALGYNKQQIIDVYVKNMDALLANDAGGARLRERIQL